MVNIPFDPDCKNIAISLSGGADSALLAYILCDNIGDLPITVHFICHTRMWKTRPWQGWDSLNVTRWFIDRFPHIKFKRHTNFIALELEYGNKGPTLVDEYGKQVSGDNIEIRAFAEYVCHWEEVDAYYNGVTRNPRDVDFKGMVERDIEPTEDNQHLAEMTHMGRKVYHPFRFISKDEIVKAYHELDILELFYITRSCEGEFEDIDYTNYVPGQFVPVCNECFWCKERAWAIEQQH